jgi:hypothetical protein
VRLGEVIVGVDSTRVTSMTDVRQLLVNNNPEVCLTLQPPRSGLMGGFTNVLNLGGAGAPPRQVTIRRPVDGGGGARRPRNGEARAEELLPPQAHAARERGRELFKAGEWLNAAEAFSEAMDGAGGGAGVSDKGRAVLLTNRALCFQKLGVWDKARATAPPPPRRRAAAPPRRPRRRAAAPPRAAYAAVARAAGRGGRAGGDEQERLKRQGALPARQGARRPRRPAPPPPRRASRRQRTGEKRRSRRGRGAGRRRC